MNKILQEITQTLRNGTIEEGLHFWYKTLKTKQSLLVIPPKRKKVNPHKGPVPLGWEALIKWLISQLKYLQISEKKIK